MVGSCSAIVQPRAAHYQRAREAGAQIASALHDHRTDYRAYEALDLEGHRWRLVQWLREVPQ